MSNVSADCANSYCPLMKNETKSRCILRRGYSEYYLFFFCICDCISKWLYSKLLAQCLCFLLLDKQIKNLFFIQTHFNSQFSRCGKVVVIVSFYSWQIWFNFLLFFQLLFVFFCEWQSQILNETIQFFFSQLNATPKIWTTFALNIHPICRIGHYSIWFHLQNKTSMKQLK